MFPVRALLADLHLGQCPGDLGRFFCATARVRARGVRELVLLGDLFRTLVAFPRFWDDTIRAGLDELASLRKDGCRVIMLEGNREFFLDDPHMDPFRDRTGMAHSFAAGGRRFLLEHGDLINRKDRRYLLWRAVSKSRTARIWARLLPRSLARRIVTGTERRLARTNFNHRRNLPVCAMQAQARSHFASGVDVLVWGHFHRAWAFEDEGRAAFVLPAWQETGTVMWVGDNGDVSFDPPLDLGSASAGERNEVAERIVDSPSRP